MNVREFALVAFTICAQMSVGAFIFLGMADFSDIHVQVFLYLLFFFQVFSGGFFKLLRIRFQFGRHTVERMSQIPQFILIRYFQLIIEVAVADFLRPFL